MVRSQQNPSTLQSDSFEECLRTVAREVEDTLEDILPPPTTRLHQAMRYSVLGGGKRLRAFLVRASSQLYGVSPREALMTAAALELIQSYSLVHDDLPCMDNADFRRGKFSCHKVFGEATATLVGDALIPLAFQTLASLKTSPEIRLELVEGLANTIGSTGLAAGQMMDLGQEGLLSRYEELLEQERLKTGVFFGFSTEAGAILGKAPASERQALKAYGLLFGEAFQMIDDWLDGCGNEGEIGKPCGQDTTKLTFLSLLGPKHLHDKAVSAIEKAIEVLSPFQGKAMLLKEVAIYTLSRMQ